MDTRLLNKDIKSRRLSHMDMVKKARPIEQNQKALGRKVNKVHL